MKIKELPFYYKSHIKQDNGGYPHVLPFVLFYDKELKMFRQKSTPELNITLRKVYEEGSLVDGSISSESGVVYIPKLLKYLSSNFDFQENSRILEVGCGSGILLNKIKDLGILDIIGIEPGNHSQTKDVSNIKIVRDFFPSNKIKGTFDCIISFGVLEHIKDPLTFMHNLAEQLNSNGKIIFAVPNCEPYLREGDISIFIHEHFNYFTRQSIINLLAKSKFYIEDISVIEGILIVTATKLKTIFKLTDEDYTFNEKIYWGNFEINISAIKDVINKYKKEKIALYAPGRALNILYYLKVNGFRLVDDNTEIYGKYLPYFTNCIESFDDLLNNPPECILIYSRTFGEQIKKKCINQSELKNTIILSLSDL